MGALDQFTSDVEMQFSFAFAGKANALGGEHGGIIIEYYGPQDESPTKQFRVMLARLAILRETT